MYRFLLLSGTGAGDVCGVHYTSSSALRCWVAKLAFFGDAIFDFPEVKPPGLLVEAGPGGVAQAAPPWLFMHPALRTITNREHRTGSPLDT